MPLPFTPLLTLSLPPSQACSMVPHRHFFHFRVAWPTTPGTRNAIRRHTDPAARRRTIGQHSQQQQSQKESPVPSPASGVRYINVTGFPNKISICGLKNLDNRVEKSTGTISNANKQSPVYVCIYIYRDDSLSKALKSYNQN